MKRSILFFIAVAFIGISVTRGQETTGGTGVPALNYNSLENKLSKSNADIEDPKKLDSPKTWLDRGELFQDINDVNIQMISFGLDPATVSAILMKKPNEVKSKVITRKGEEVSQEVQSYDRIDFNFEGGVLVSWVETQVITPDPLFKALDAYNKVVELDAEKKLAKKLKNDLDRLRTQSEQKAYNLYTLEDYKGAYDYFLNYINCGKFYVYDGIIDTANMFNAALCAVLVKMYPEAISLFKEVKKYNYSTSTVIVSLKDCYLAIGDSATALNILQEGFKSNPSDIVVLNELINFYLVAGKDAEALNYLQLAKQSDPTNKTYFYAEGTLYDKMKDYPNAILSYEGALEIDPEFFEANYNIAVAHYNNAVEDFNDSNDPSLSNEEFDKLRARAQSEFEKAIPYMLKAHELKPKDMDTMVTLKQFYFRLQMNDELEQIKKEIEAAGGK